MTNTDKALQTFSEGYNCAQAVFMTFAEQLGLPAETAAKISSGFGGGMHIGSKCGVVTGAFMALGLKFGEGKKRTYDKTSEFTEKFLQRNPSTRCLDLLGVDVRLEEELQIAKNEGLFRKICDNLVKDACEILEEIGI
ncbi:MAG: C_GCAxxG_C_C family protein [Planctomycetes bacterium]|nr:C_GCAxxG_C_C family protein [Planctomycetota bacterium]